MEWIVISFIGKSEIKAEITFIFSNEHVYDLNVQYDLIWWEYA